MNLYGNLSGVVENTKGGWYYGLEITNATDIDSCPIILPLSFASSAYLINRDDFYREAKMIAKVIDYGNFKEVGFHVWSGTWNEKESMRILFVIALPKNTKTLYSEPNKYDKTPPVINPGFYIKSGAPTPIYTRMKDGLDTESSITNKVRTDMKDKVNSFISKYGVNNLPFKLKDSSDYYDTFMEILKDREFVAICNDTNTATLPIDDLTLSGSFYIQ